MSEKEPTGGWEFSGAYNLFTETQKQEYDFRRTNFFEIETPDKTLEYVRKWIK